MALKQQFQHQGFQREPQVQKAWWGLMPAHPKGCNRASQRQRALASKKTQPALLPGWVGLRRGCEHV